MYQAAILRIISPWSKVRTGLDLAGIIGRSSQKETLKHNVNVEDVAWVRIRYCLITLETAGWPNVVPLLDIIFLPFDDSMSVYDFKCV